MSLPSPCKFVQYKRQPTTLPEDLVLYLHPHGSVGSSMSSCECNAPISVASQHPLVINVADFFHVPDRERAVGCHVDAMRTAFATGKEPSLALYVTNIYERALFVHRPDSNRLYRVTLTPEPSPPHRFAFLDDMCNVLVWKLSDKYLALYVTHSNMLMFMASSANTPNMLPFLAFSANARNMLPCKDAPKAFTTVTSVDFGLNTAQQVLAVKHSVSCFLLYVSSDVFPRDIKTVVVKRGKKWENVWTPELEANMTHTAVFIGDGAFYIDLVAPCNTNTDDVLIGLRNGQLVQASTARRQPTCAFQAACMAINQMMPSLRIALPLPIWCVSPERDRDLSLVPLTDQDRMCLFLCSETTMTAAALACKTVGDAWTLHENHMSLYDKRVKDFFVNTDYRVHFSAMDNTMLETQNMEESRFTEQLLMAVQRLCDTDGGVAPAVFMTDLSVVKHDSWYPVVMTAYMSVFTVGFVRGDKYRDGVDSWDAVADAYPQQGDMITLFMSLSNSDSKMCGIHPSVHHVYPTGVTRNIMNYIFDTQVVHVDGCTALFTVALRTHLEEVVRALEAKFPELPPISNTDFTLLMFIMTQLHTSPYEMLALVNNMPIDCGRLMEDIVEAAPQNADVLRLDVAEPYERRTDMLIRELAAAVIGTLPCTFAQIRSVCLGGGVASIAMHIFPNTMYKTEIYNSKRVSGLVGTTVMEHPSTRRVPLKTVDELAAEIEAAAPAPKPRRSRQKPRINVVQREMDKAIRVHNVVKMEALALQQPHKLSEASLAQAQHILSVYKVVDNARRSKDWRLLQQVMDANPGFRFSSKTVADTAAVLALMDALEADVVDIEAVRVAAEACSAIKLSKRMTVYVERVLRPPPPSPPPPPPRLDPKLQRLSVAWRTQEDSLLPWPSALIWPTYVIGKTAYLSQPVYE